MFQCCTITMACNMLLVFALVGLLVTPTIASDANKNSNMAAGRLTLVHLFEWRWDDIANECETFLGPYGYGGLQVSPPNENAVIMDSGVQRPWYERYQPVSYLLETRSGNNAAFTDMVRRCNNAGVRVYVDGVINHMTGDSLADGYGSGGSHYDSNNLDYDAVPYSAADFNSCQKCGTSDCGIQNYGDVYQVRNCRLVGLKDLDQGLEHVRERITEYLNRLVAIGVAGFRFDASKHMWPGDINAIVERIDDLNTAFFPGGGKPLIYQEVIDMGGEPISVNDYNYIGRTTQFKYGFELGNCFRRRNPMKWLYNFGQEWGLSADRDALVFIDNHDNQRTDHDAIITFREPRLYKMATAYMLAWPYGLTRVMSSFYWDQNIQNGNDLNSWQGPPHDSNYNILHVSTNPDLTCNDGWICEHRWRQIYNMVKFRNVVDGTGVENWWDNGAYQIAFSRGNRGFLAINNEDFSLTATLNTGLPAGSYCDVITGGLSGGSCTGRVITVNGSGQVSLDISNTWEDPVIAIHVDAKL